MPRVLLAFAVVACIAIGTQGLTKTCLSTSTAKTSPSSNSDVFSACQVYQNNSCCSATFTQQLSSPVKGVGNFSWLQCGQAKLSSKCERFQVAVECFYRCSPNVAFWQNPTYKAGFLGAPLCSNFCDDWFDACKDDLTCAEDWLTGFNYTSSGENTCKTPCKKFSEYYKNGTGLCTKQWGDSFKYSQKSGECLNLNFNGANPNNAVVEKLFGGAGKSTAKPMPVSPTSSASQIMCGVGAIAAAFTGLFVFL
ncbi:riboflavin-binding protein isoform X2 [Nematostella vectensis]|nr:riboflavin-binding protein isoform X2 [Nematostella vectensis]